MTKSPAKTGDFPLFLYFLQRFIRSLDGPESPCARTKILIQFTSPSYEPRDQQKAALSDGILFNNLACNQEQRGFFVIAFVASSKLEL